MQRTSRPQVPVAEEKDCPEQTPSLNRTRNQVEDRIVRGIDRFGSSHGFTQDGATGGALPVVMSTWPEGL